MCVTSASKAWNLAGLKCAVIVAGSEAMDARLAERIPPYLGAHASLFGVLAATAAFEHGDEWLDALLRHLDRNRVLLGELLGEHLPAVRYVPPEAGYLAWLDCSELGLGDRSRRGVPRARPGRPERRADLRRAGPRLRAR